MEISDVLQKIGLNEKEAKVYLALLELGTASAYAIAPKAGLKRPITYIVLESLMQKGLVSRIPRVKKALYTAEAPEKLSRELRQKEELLKRFMPNLEALYNGKKEKPQVLLFEGKEGVNQVYEKIFQAGSCLFFGTAEGVASLNQPWIDDFFKRVNENNFPVRDIISRSPHSEAYGKNPYRGPSYELRYMPKGFSVPADSAIFGDNVAFFSFKPTIFCVVVTSKDIAILMRTMHELAWRSGEPYEKVLTSGGKKL